MQISDTTRGEAFRLFGRLVARSDPGRLEAWADLGLTMTQLRLLFLLRPADGLSAGAIADQLGVTPSTLTRIMDRLVRHDLVRRENDCNDRRLVRHHLTAEARRIIEEMERFGRARMDRILARLGPAQLERVVLALRDLSAAFEAAEVGEKTQEALA
ncbi:MAG: MarR family transcriptional regulator [Chloroflexi bacterium]|nr:MAG: MarR family transcriptional regulator [Chloroflexota bacterium]